MKNLLLILIVFMTCASPAALGNNAPIPPRKSEALEQLKSRLEQEKSEAETLKKKMAQESDALEKTRKELISLSASLQKSQKNLSDLETRIAGLEKEEEALNNKIKDDYGSMGDLILAMERLRRMPVETLVLRPGAPLETAQSTLLLQSILPAINTRTQQMAADLNRMKAIHQSLQEDKNAADKTAATLQAQEKDLQSLLKNRERLYGQTRSAYDTQAQSVARMAAEAQSLEQLVAQLEKTRREEEAREREARKREAQEQQRKQEEQRKASVASRSTSRAKPPALPGGIWPSPVQGRIHSNFGESNEIGAKSEGIRISAAPHALVTAPAGGIIRFSGPFRNYGNMVIIEHDKGFHSLISGLQRIDTAVGRKISAGEPLGTLTGSGAKGQPTLYYELRHNGKPVNPSAKFPDLS